jgi:hypothetical protein
MERAGDAGAAKLRPWWPPSVQSMACAEFEVCKVRAAARGREGGENTAHGDAGVPPCPARVGRRSECPS